MIDIFGGLLAHRDRMCQCVNHKCRMSFVY